MIGYDLTINISNTECNSHNSSPSSSPTLNYEEFIVYEENSCLNDSLQSPKELSDIETLNSNSSSMYERFDSISTNRTNTSDGDIRNPSLSSSIESNRLNTVYITSSKTKHIQGNATDPSNILTDTIHISRARLIELEYIEKHFADIIKLNVEKQVGLAK